MDKNKVGTPIKQEEHVRDLGVVVSCCGDFEKHIIEKSTKRKQMAGWILRTFETREVESMELRIHQIQLMNNVTLNCYPT